MNQRQKQFTEDIYFEIIEGKQFFVSNVSIEGNINLSKDEVQKTLNIYKNKPYNSVLLNERVATLQKELELFSKLFSIIEIERNNNRSKIS